MTSNINKPTAPPTSNKKKKKSGFNLDFIKSPIFIGLMITFSYLLIAQNYYTLRTQQESTRLQQAKIKQWLYNAVDWVDLKSQDGKFIIRGPQKPAPEVALLTIDDRSIEQIGRWPWSREKIAHVISEMNKYGAASIGFDIVFSEEQENEAVKTLNRIESETTNIPANIKALFDNERSKNDPDSILAGTLAQHKDKLVMGSFNEDSDDSSLKPYQDYCRNEAFKRANADKFVKLNATFIVNDEADPFVDIEFDKIFTPLFSALEKAQTEKALKEIFNKKSTGELNQYELRQLSYLVQTEDMKFCDRWLTDDDPWIQDLKEQYLAIFKKSKLLADLPLEQALDTFKKSTKFMPIVQHQRWTINTDKIQDAVDYTGSFNAEQDADGTIRRTSLFFRTGNRIGTSFIPSIALQTYLIATGYRADIEINHDPKNPEQKIINKFNIVNPQKEPEELISQVPVDSLGRMPINYAGGTNMYAYLPAKELFNGKETALISQAEWNPETKKWNTKDNIEVKKADFIKGKAFIFGATAIGVYDLRVTPFEKNYPGPETHASALGNLFLKNFLKKYSKEHFFMMWALLLFGALLSLAISHTTAIPGFLITFFSLAGVFGVDQYFFQNGYMVTMALPGGLIAFLYVFLFFYKYLTEERKKKHLRSTFSKYVSPAIVDEILKDPENIELGGKKVRMSVFFSDVRGFTTISEKLDPQVLSDVLNKYLTPMTQIVFANKGTLDKYMGDAVMAFFGAPIFFPDHAKYACRCALESIRKLKEIQTEFAAQGLPNIDIGIGINSADMSVGNMGSDIVRSYTVMGDAVNLGSRLEGINKEYGTRIIISQFTYEDVKNDFTCREIDWVRVKGKLEPVRIFELICEGKPDEKTGKMLEHFGQGFVFYHERKFQEALNEFKKALEINSEDPPSKLYVERCEDYLQEPPPENWDGVYVMKTK